MLQPKCGREATFKSQVLKQLKKLDDSQSGTINFNVFFNMLACLDIGLSQSDEELIKDRHAAGKDTIYY